MHPTLLPVLSARVRSLMLDASGQPRRNVIHHCRAEMLLDTLPDGCVQLIVTDPPYFKVLDKQRAAWDHQWDSAAAYIEWMGELCQQWRRVLAPNGSLYVFAWPDIAARVELEIGKHFNVLNHIVWRKEQSRHKSADIDGLRGYFPQTERVIFAEQYGSDETADDASGYTLQCVVTKRGIFGEYLSEEFQRAGVVAREVCEAIKAYGKVNHGGAVSNWLIGYNCPTAEQYQKMRDWLNSLNGGEYLKREYEYLKREYEYLKREYEDLKREYEDLRRPFNVSPDVPFTDVWDFPAVSAYPGKHPAEKPLAMIEHIIRASSRPGDLVLDCFSGSGTTADAARRNGRDYVACDMDAHWVAYGRNRASLPYAVPLFDAA